MTAFNMEDIRTSPDKVKCPKCNEIIDDKKYVVHYRNAHGCLPPGFPEKKKFICDQCSQEFTSKDRLKKHVHNVHEQEEKEQKMPSKKIYVCIQCNNTSFKGTQPYVNHYRSVHHEMPPEYSESNKVYCEQCGKVFLNDKHLKNHVLYSHEKKYRYKNPSKKFKCQHCEKIFAHRRNFQEHVQAVHEQNTPHECQECHRKFAFASSLSTHKRLTHTKVKCDICQSTLYSAFFLKKHKAQVHGVTPEGAFHCDHCTLIFMNEGSLKNHVLKKHA